MKKVLFLLGQLRDTDVEWMSTQGRRLKVRAGDVLIHEGRSLDALFILLDGTLAISGTGAVGGVPVHLGCGEVVGEISFVDSRPPTATVTAAEDSVVLAVPRQQLKDRLDQDAEFAARFYRSLAMFLAHRFRYVTKFLACGKGRPLPQDLEDADELSAEILNTLHQAGARFDRVLQRLLGG